jgi:hypothetical protein
MKMTSSVALREMLPPMKDNEGAQLRLEAASNK